ncbi:hypothetical protein FY046_05305 [Erwinia sp. 1181_3]|uniref:hypothetical protein n=1 Tax=Erwinia sp. 1181_3 TaxID=2605957 RepID=UPI0040589FA8
MISTVYFNIAHASSDHDLDLLCIYLSDKSIQNNSDFYEQLTDSIRGSNTLPDAIIVFYSTTIESKVINAWSDLSQNKAFLPRLGPGTGISAKSIFFISMSQDGLKLDGSIGFNKGSIYLKESDYYNLYLSGMNGLAVKNKILHVAPSGHSFRHPSGTTSKLFIQAKEIARNEAELQFIARGICLSSKEIAWNELKSVFIDSMGIYGIVKEALKFSGSDAKIINFHSYEKVGEINAPADDYLVIISASTSGGMAKLLVKSGFSHKRIITLAEVSLRNKLCSTPIIIPLEKDIQKKTDSTKNHETEIELVGEQFTSKAKQPREIILGIRHKPDALEDVLNTFAFNGLNDLNTKLDSFSSSVPVLSLKPEALMECKAFNEWLEAELKWEVAASISTIVYKKDGASELLAAKVKKLLDELRQSKKGLSLIEADDLKHDSLMDCSGVMVVSAFTGDGGQLRQISRSLREYEPRVIPRHFLTGVVISQTMEEWSRLKRFLVQNAMDRKYGFSAWKTLPIGPDIMSDSWSDLTGLVAYLNSLSLSEDGPVLSEEESQSIALLQKVVKESRSRLLPNTANIPLKLTSGFVFFSETLENRLSEINQSVVLLAIASVLQAAREHSVAELCLKSDNYQSVVLSPENFLRFNDDILQACILRASLPNEIDYSFDYDLSLVMSEFLLKLFNRHNRPYGYAALEFAAALATGKLRLKEQHLKSLIHDVLYQGRLEQGCLYALLIAAKIKNKL